MSLFSSMLRAHQWIYVNTDGLLGHRLLFGNPTLLLRTTGRRTGLPRTNALIYARDGDAYLVVASKGGAPQPPAWLANLTAEPDCDIQIGRRHHRVTARATLPGDPDYARRWQLINAANANRYNAYQDKTERRIAIVELRPKASA